MHQAEAALAVDQAAAEAARLNLGYAEIRAPFAGRLGRNQAAKGALVGPASGPLNTLVQLDPIYVSFNPSESELAEIAKARAAGKVEAEISLAGRVRRRAQGRADLSRQCHRQVDRHDLGARDDRQSRLRSAARANMSACGCTSRTSRTR